MKEKNVPDETLYSPPYTVGDQGCRYTNLPLSPEGWVDATKFYPLPYDLCELYLKDKIRTGWWTGQGWFGRRLKQDEKVLFWKKEKEMNFS